MRQLTDLRVLHGGDLRISLTAAGRAELKAERDQALAAASAQDLADLEGDLLEWWRCNDTYDWIGPEEIGALTSAPILGHDVERGIGHLLLEDHTYEVSVVTSVTGLWWYPAYELRDWVRELARDGFVVFTAVAMDDDGGNAVAATRRLP